MASEAMRFVLFDLGYAMKLQAGEDIDLPPLSPAFPATKSMLVVGRFSCEGE
jgi:hypothetical protein